MDSIKIHLIFRFQHQGSPECSSLRRDLILKVPRHRRLKNSSFSSSQPSLKLQSKVSQRDHCSTHIPDHLDGVVRTTLSAWNTSDLCIEGYRPGAEVECQSHFPGPLTASASPWGRSWVHYGPWNLVLALQPGLCSRKDFPGGSFPLKTSIATRQLPSQLCRAVCTGLSCSHSQTAGWVSVGSLTLTCSLPGFCLSRHCFVHDSDRLRIHLFKVTFKFLVRYNFDRWLQIFLLFIKLIKTAWLQVCSSPYMKVFSRVTVRTLPPLSGNRSTHALFPSFTRK